MSLAALRRFLPTTLLSTARLLDGQFHVSFRRTTLAQMGTVVSPALEPLHRSSRSEPCRHAHPHTAGTAVATVTPPAETEASFETFAVWADRPGGPVPHCASDSAQKLLAETHRWPNATRHHLSPTGASLKSSRESRSSHALRNQNGRREPPPLNLLCGLFCQGAFGLSSQRPPRRDGTRRVACRAMTHSSGRHHDRNTWGSVNWFLGRA